MLNNAYAYIRRTRVHIEQNLCLAFSVCCIFQEKKVEQLTKVLSELLQFIDERHAAGELMVDDEKLFEKIKSKDSRKLDELEGFIGEGNVLLLVCIGEYYLVLMYVVFILERVLPGNIVCCVYSIITCTRRKYTLYTLNLDSNPAF